MTYEEKIKQLAKEAKKEHGTCPTCKGNRYVIVNGEPDDCPKCGGAGVV